MNLEGIKQLSKTRWAIRVNRREQRTGRCVNRKATVIGTRADAVRRRDELRLELDRGNHERRRLRLREFAADWLDRRVLKPSTRQKYEFSLRHINAELGDVYLDQLAPSDVAAYVAQRMRRAAGYTVLNELRLMRVIAKDAVSDGLSIRYWCDRVKPPKGKRYDDAHTNLLTPEQARRVLEHVPAQWYGLLVFVLTTGLRFGEASALHWEDVDAGVAHIHRGNWRGNETTVKNAGSNRGVPALPEVVALWGARRSSGLVFPTRTGGLHRGSPLRRVLDRACAAAGVPRITTHGLRRSFNNEGRQLASSREVLKAITGHTTDEMVEHYSHVGADEKIKLARAVATRMGVLRPSSDKPANEGNR